MRSCLYFGFNASKVVIFPIKRVVSIRRLANLRKLALFPAELCSAFFRGRSHARVPRYIDTSINERPLVRPPLFRSQTGKEDKRGQG